MGYGSAGTPPWADDEKIDQERRELKTAESAKKIELLEKENEALKSRIKELEKELIKLKRKGKFP
jgi:predicted RNase H-like nuclease (RuvC/YqgF family)